MRIAEDFMSRFEELIRESDSGVRLTAKTGKFQKESSMRPLYERLKRAQTTSEDIAWDPTITDLLTGIPAAKQRKYAVAIKYLEKTLMNQQSKIFSTLRKLDLSGRPLSEKLSKSQQRYTNLMVGVSDGVCSQLALLWLEEQFRTDGAATRFPRLADKNVIESKEAHALTRDAFQLQTLKSLDAQAAARGLQLTSTWLKVSFDTFARIFKDRKDQGVFIAFHESHGIGLFRESKDSWLFYDGNAGSYRVAHDNLREFLLEYNNVCLPKKWTGYSSPTTADFTAVLSVSKAPPPKPS